MSEARLFTATTFPEIYERILVGPLFRPFAEQLVTRLAPHRGDSAIDVACGTGICARIVRERLGPEAPIVGIDIAPAMLAVARTVEPTIHWREGSATSLPVGPAERFSVLTCHQGLQFMPDKQAAIHEMRRVLTDVAGEPYWTIVAEARVDKIDDFFAMEHTLMSNATLQKTMADYHELVASGRREIYRIEN